MFSYVLEKLLPHILGPMGSDGIQHESLLLDPVKNKVLVHANRSGRIAVGISRTLEFVESSLKSELVRGTKKKSVGATKEGKI